MWKSWRVAKSGEDVTVQKRMSASTQGNLKVNNRRPRALSERKTSNQFTMSTSRNYNQ